MDDFTPQIVADGGLWGETEVLGDRAIVKVRASAETITVLDSVFKRLPKDRLDDSLGDLPKGVINALKNEVLDMGYTLAQAQDTLGADWKQKTLRDVLEFMATRRRQSRYDAENNLVVLDGPDQHCRPIGHVDMAVR